MEPAAHHPALVAAVEALSNAADQWRKLIFAFGVADSRRGEALKQAGLCESALALLRAAMEKAETMYVEGEENDFERHVYRCKRTMPRRHDDEVRYRVTVLRWEE